MSPSGALAGYYLDDGKEYGFMYSGGTYTRLKIPDSTETNGTGINASGEVAGDYTKGSETFGFVYSDGTYATINIPDSMNTYVTGINASGAVMGYYFSATDGTDLGFIATPAAAAVSMMPAVVAAPEPSTWAMLLSSFAGLGLVGYGRARSGRPTLLA